MKKIIHGILLISSSLAIGNLLWLMIWSSLAELSIRLFICSGIAAVIGQLYILLFFIANLPEIK